MLTGTDIDIHRIKANWSGVGNCVITPVKLQGLTHKLMKISSCFDLVSSYPGTGAATQCSAHVLVPAKEASALWLKKKFSWDSLHPCFKVFLADSPLSYNLYIK